MTPASPAHGLFLAFEGVEGAGKSTQVARLAAYLEKEGLSVVVAREPGSTPLGERIRATVLGEGDLSVPPVAELFLMLAARAAFVDQVVKPALGAGKIVLADRFELSTLAYQGAGRGLGLEDIRQCNRLATGGLAPDLTLLLDLEPEAGRQRQRLSAKVPDRIERQNSAFHERVACGYHELAAFVGGLVRIDAEGGIDEVHARVRAELERRFPETFFPREVIKENRSGSAVAPDQSVQQQPRRSNEG